MKIKKSLVVLLVMAVFGAACTTESWEIKTNTGITVRTECDGNSCVSTSGGQKVKCKKDQLVNRSYSAGWISRSLPVCPSLRALIDSGHSTDLAALQSSYRLTVQGAEKVALKLDFDLSLARDAEIRRGSGPVFCEVKGEALSREMFEILDHRVRLKRPADSVVCQIPE